MCSAATTPGSHSRLMKDIRNFDSTNLIASGTLDTADRIPKQARTQTRIADFESHVRFPSPKVIVCKSDNERINSSE